MPWCASCDRFLSPSTVRLDGTCPACGRAVDPGRARPPAPGDPADPGAAADAETRTEAPPVPWHFKAFLAAFALYLGWRAWDLVTMLT